MFIFEVNNVGFYFNRKNEFNGKVLLLDRLRYCCLLYWNAFFCKKRTNKNVIRFFECIV